MFEALVSPFMEFDFMRRALVGVIILSISSAPVGVFLMLRRMSLTGDAMSHAILPGAAIGFLVAGLSVPAMTIGGMVAGLLVALGSGLVARLTALREDTSLAAFYLISLALGVVIVSMRGSNTDLLHVLFGSVLALENDALILLGLISTMTLLSLAILYRPLVMDCVDPGFLRSIHSSGTLTHLVFMSLVVINLVGGFQALGTLLSVGMMILPAASARFWTRDLSALLVLAMLFGVTGGIFGLVLSYHSEWPTGPAMIIALGTLYLVSLILGKADGLIQYLKPKHHLQA